MARSPSNYIKKLHAFKVKQTEFYSNRFKDYANKILFAKIMHINIRFWGLYCDNFVKCLKCHFILLQQKTNLNVKLYPFFCRFSIDFVLNFRRPSHASTIPHLFNLSNSHFFFFISPKMTHWVSWMAGHVATHNPPHVSSPWGCEWCHKRLFWGHFSHAWLP